MLARLAQHECAALVAPLELEGRVVLADHDLRSVVAEILVAVAAHERGSAPERDRSLAALDAHDRHRDRECVVPDVV
jgi:hypothetical protein